MNETRRPGRFRRWVTRGFTALGVLVFALVLILLLVSLLGRQPVPRRVIVELDLERGLVESVPEDPIGSLLRRDQLTVRDAVDALKRAETDDRVRGLVARVGGGMIGMAQAEELRGAVESFRATGKPAILFAETFGEFAPGRAEYYLATAFEEIHLQPSGDVGLAGFSVEIPFLAAAFERFGLQAQMEGRHEYKDGVNLFLEEEMTGPQREATERVLRSTYENLVAGIAAGRGLDPAAVTDAIDRGPLLAQEALQARLVDRLSYRDEAYEAFEERVEGGEFLPAQTYLRRAGRPYDRGPVIALIHGTGMVMRGESQSNPLAGGTVMGAETVARAFRAAVDAADVQAIVFRVDSPGGSYVASDVIWREVARAREAGKPVIVSMGDVAASGGYFVAMGADRIVAHPSTLTGSIGVYGGKILVRELSESVGVTWDGVQVGGNAGMWSIVDEYSPSERERMQASLDRIYDDFTEKVARGRGLSRDSTDAIARGRVWSGADAHRLGLVDELGGFETALRAARELASLEADARIQVRAYPRPRTLVEMIVQPRPQGGYPSGVATLVRAAAWMEAVAMRAQELGLAGGRGVLTAPMPAVR